MSSKEKLVYSPTFSRRKVLKVGLGLATSFLIERFWGASAEAAFSYQYFPETGFYVRDREAPFYSGFQKFGGLPTFGYPISRHYQKEGIFYQAFQRGILSSKPGLKEVSLAPLMNWFSREGKDGWLERFGIPPAVEGERSREEQLSWLKEEKIKKVYFRYPSLYGLPTSEPRQNGTFIIQRFENYALQLWQEEVSGMPPRGSVVGVLAGELAKQAGGFIPQETLSPEEPPSKHEPEPKNPENPGKDEEQKEAVYSGGVLYRGPHVAEVAITSDDGWWPEQIKKQIEITQKHGIKMSFFLVGRLLGESRWKGPIKKLLEAGFELQNHTWSHAWLTRCSSEQIAWEIKKAQEAIFAWTGGQGNSGRYLRPPFGAYDARVVEIANNLGLEVVFWSGSSGGTSTGKDGGLIDSWQCLANLKATTGWGSIPLIHTNWNDTGALEPYIDWLKSAGMSPVLLTKLVPPRNSA